MFNTSEDITLKLNTPNGTKTVMVTFPTDEQWQVRSNRTKITSRNLGRGKTETEVNRPEKVNADLYDTIFKSGDELDEYEKSKVIERLGRCEVEESASVGNGYEVKLNVPGGIVTHWLKLPSAKQVNQFKKAFLRVVDARRYQETTVNIAATETLYDSIVERKEGYAGDVPIIHKAAVIGEVIALLNEDNGEGEIEGF